MCNPLWGHYEVPKGIHIKTEAFLLLAKSDKGNHQVNH